MIFVATSDLARAQTAKADLIEDTLRDEMK
jgi:hypothetical protein